jgi:phospholipase/carboxylesterase
MSGSHIAAKEWAARFETRRGLPVFMSHGQDDIILPFGVSRSLSETLTAHGLNVVWMPFRGGHGIPPEVLAAAGSFLVRVLA